MIHHEASHAAIHHHHHHHGHQEELSEQPHSSRKEPARYELKAVDSEPQGVAIMSKAGSISDVSLKISERRSIVDADKWQQVLRAQGVSTSFLEDPDKAKLPFVDRNSFEIAIGCAIGCNAVVMGVEADIRNEQNEDDIHWLILENIFCLIWVFEVGAKLYYHRVKYFFSTWNLFDFSLAMLSVGDAWIMPAVGGGNGMRSITLLRVMRFARMVRLLRLLRMMRMFRELWLIVNGFLEALRTLIWVLLLMGIILYVGGIVMVHVVGRACDTVYVGFPDCQSMFGSLGQSMFTLFQVITLESWSQAIARPIITTQPALIVFFVPFLFITTFGLLNVIVGVIVENTLEAAKQNSGLQERRLEFRLRRDLEMLRKVFEEADSDLNGGVDLQEFMAILRRQDVQKALKALQIPVHEPEAVFELMDVEHRGLLSVEDFVNSAMQMRKPPQELDLRQMTVQIRGVQRRFKQVEDSLKILQAKVSERSAASPTDNTLLYPPTINHYAGKPNAAQAREYGKAWQKYAAALAASAPPKNAVNANSDSTQPSQNTGMPKEAYPGQRMATHPLGQIGQIARPPLAWSNWAQENWANSLDSPRAPPLPQGNYANSSDSLRDPPLQTTAEAFPTQSVATHPTTSVSPATNLPAPAWSPEQMQQMYAWMQHSWAQNARAQQGQLNTGAA